jgi:hypothetical protein
MPVKALARLSFRLRFVMSELQHLALTISSLLLLISMSSFSQAEH